MRENRRAAAAFPQQQQQQSHQAGFDLQDQSSAPSVARTTRNAAFSHTGSKPHLFQPFTVNTSDRDVERDDSDFDDDDDDDDPILASIRERRLHEMMRQAQHQNQAAAANASRGLGDYRTIAQDEFLPECLQTNSAYVAIHFFHDQFERCKIMDHHLRIVAKRFATCKFLRINAEKAPFFVQKLQIRTLPTLLVLNDGQVVDRLIGFEGLSSSTNDPDQWRTSQLQMWLSTTGAIVYHPSNSDSSDDDEDVDAVEHESNKAKKRLQVHRASLYARTEDKEDW